MLHKSAIICFNVKSNVSIVSMAYQSCLIIEFPLGWTPLLVKQRKHSGIS
jgi:hypothetical protein